MEQNSQDFLPKLETKVCENVVLFAKAETSQERPDLRYKEALNKCCDINVETFFLSPIAFEFINSEILHDCLADSTEYSGVVLTSTRCVESLIRATVNDRDILNNWSHLPIFTVGKQTKEYLKSKTNLDSFGFDSGSGKELAKFIVQQNNNDKFQKPLLYP